MNLDGASFIGSSTLQMALYGLDIIVVSWLIYRALLVVRGTRAVPMLMGLGLVVSAYLVARSINLNTVAWILGNFLSSIVLVVVVIFQDEIRRALTKVGLTRIFFDSTKPISDRSIEELVLIAQRLSADRLGALIVIQGKIGLDEIVDEGVKLDAILSRKLILSIFNKASPLHDGAVVIKESRIKAAGCVLPLSINPELDPNLGTRHRAAVGVSERSDAYVLVVSEQSGEISLAKEGKLSKALDISRLRDALLASSYRSSGVS